MALDWADQEHAWALQVPGSEKREHGKLAQTPEAIEEWAAFAREVGADYIQLSAALHPDEADIPPEAMLDPVANTLDLRRPFDERRARRVESGGRTAR